MGTRRRLCNHTSMQTTRAAFLPCCLSDKRDVQAETEQVIGTAALVTLCPAVHSREGVVVRVCNCLRRGCMLSGRCCDALEMLSRCKFTAKGNLHGYVHEGIPRTG